MKIELKTQALELRRQGYSLNEIASEVPVAKSTLSLWLRDVPLEPEFILRLRERAHNRTAGHELFRQEMSRQRRERWAAFQAEALEEWPVLKNDGAFMLGLGLYIGEGGKSCENQINLSNCEAGVIMRAIEFFERIGARREKMSVAVQIHPGLDALAAQEHWQRVTHLPLAQFNRAVISLSRASQGKRGNIQPNGTCRITVGDTRLRQKVGVWMNLALYHSPDRPDYVGCDLAEVEKDG